MVEAPTRATEAGANRRPRRCGPVALPEPVSDPVATLTLNHPLGAPHQ